MTTLYSFLSLWQVHARDAGKFQASHTAAPLALYRYGGSLETVWTARYFALLESAIGIPLTS